MTKDTPIIRKAQTLYIKSGEQYVPYATVGDQNEYDRWPLGQYLMSIESGCKSYTRLRGIITDQIEFLSKTKRFREILVKCLSDASSMKTSIPLTPEEDQAWRLFMSKCRPAVRLQYDSYQGIADRAIEKFDEQISKELIQKLDPNE